MSNIHIYDRAEILQMYLDWFNNFLTIPRFAEYYGISEDFAEKVILPVGRETLNEQLSDGKHIHVESMERVRFVGIDRFNRPVFKSLDKSRRFYGSTSTLFSDYADEEEVLRDVTEDDLVYFGDYFDCEPMGTAATNLIIVKGKK